MTRLVRRLSLLVIAAAPVAATAFGVTARAGLMYSQVDSWPVEGASTSTPYLDVDLALEVKGVIVSRDVVDYRLSSSWNRISNETADASRSTRTFLSYSGQASIFQNPVSPVGLTVFVSRGESDFSTSTDADSFGRGTSLVGGAGLSLKGEHLPALSANYAFSNSQSRIGDLPLRESTLHTLGSSLSFGTSAFSLSADYYGEFREGSWDTDDYSTHSITMNASAWLGGNILSLASSSSFNVPKELVPGTFEQKTTSFSALLNAGEAGSRRNFSYGFGHTITESPGAPTGEISRQGVRYEGDHFVTHERFFTRWLLDASIAETRSDVTTLRTTGETLGVALWWRRVVRTYTLELNAGPRVALLQSEVEVLGQAPQRSEGGGYGASAGARLSRPLGAHSVQADWNASYGQDLFATAGWQFSQALGATLSGPMARARYNLSLRANSFRTHSPVSGDGAGRQLEATGILRGARLSLDGRARVSSGIVGATPQQFTSDGLLLPAPFNSTVMDAGIGAQLKLFSGVASGLRVRVARSDVPGRPVLHEAGGIASLTYRYGALGITLEDRLSRIETAAGWTTSNLVMVSVYRSLSW